SAPLDFVLDERGAPANGRLLGLRHNLDARRLERPREGIALELMANAQLERLERRGYAAGDDQALGIEAVDDDREPAARGAAAPADDIEAVRFAPAAHAHHAPGGAFCLEPLGADQPDARPRDVGLETPLPAADARAPVEVDRHVAELATVATLAPHEP